MLRDPSAYPVALYDKQYNSYTYQRPDFYERVLARRDKLYRSASAVPTYSVGTRAVPFIDTLPLTSRRPRGNGMY